MQLTVPGIVVDYDATAEQWSVEDQATGIVVYTNDPSAVYGLVQAMGVGQDETAGPYRDSGDKDPHA